MGKKAPLLGALVWSLLALLGLLLLFVLPLARLALLAAGLGLAPLAIFYVVEGVVLLARSVSPWRGSTWFKGKDAWTPDVVVHAMGLELGVSVVVTMLLIATRTLWQPLVHVDVPAWIVGFIALRAAGSSALVTMAVLRRPIALVLSIIDHAFVLPVVALAYGSLGGAVVVAAFLTWILVLAVAWMPAMQKLPSEKPRPPDDDRWKLGSWLVTIEHAARRPVLAAVGGLSLVVPSIAAILLTSLMLAPMAAAAVTRPSKEPGSRLARGIIVGSAAVMFVYLVGPALFRAVFPATFGDGTAAMHILAWTGAALFPMSLYTDPVEASQLRVGIGGLIALGVLLALAIGHGVDGVFWAAGCAALVSCTLGTTNRDSKDPIVSI